MKKALFIDRDGTLIVEPPVDFQVDSLEKLEFFPGVFSQLKKIVDQLDYDLVLVTNQDGLGTDSFPEDTFWPAQNKMIKAFENEGVFFEDVLIDRTFESDGMPTRKPGTGMFAAYLNGEYDLDRSVVIGDRWSDVQLAKNLGAKSIKIGSQDTKSALSANLITDSWVDIYQFLLSEERTSTIERVTSETSIKIDLNLNGSGRSKVNTGLKFFDHMLEQIAKHGLVDLDIQVDGDLEVDEHHTIEDTAIALGEAFKEALGNKLGIQRYGYCLPMDDCLAQVAIDFGGRNWIEWDAEFSREKVGDMPTEMFFHFFKSFTDGAQCNLNIKAEGKNEHHKIEAIFKSLAKSIGMAVKQDLNRMVLPTTKGVL